VSLNKREKLEDELDDLFKKVFKMCDEDKLKLIVNICGDTNSVLNILFDNGLDLYELDSHDNTNLEHWINRIKNAYISIYNDKVDKIMLETEVGKI
jgi:hypothetical protein